MTFDANYNPYHTARPPVVGQNGMVATSHPLAAQAGLDVLKAGGNAVDAAVAAAACLTVVEPTSNGIGGDAFAIVWMNGEMHGLNASGKSPAGISAQAVLDKGFAEMPKFGFLPVTVPGAPGAWAALSGRFGNLALSQSLSPAVGYARHGHPVAPVVAKYWQGAYRSYKRLFDGPEFAAWFDTFAPNGNAPEVGEIWKSEGHANTLEEIGRTNAKSFYNGSLANEIAEFSAKYGGFLTKEDLESHVHEWVAPLSVNYRGYDVWELPPNGQGLVALIALNILKGYEFTHRDDVTGLHRQFEAMKLAFAAGKEFITDPSRLTISPNEYLTDAYADLFRSKITDTAAEPVAIAPNKGGTVYLCTGDKWGNMVSYIQSNYMGFGSGLVVPGTGIALQNRGCDFSLDLNHANVLVGGKRTYHTIIPGFMTKGGRAIGPFGVMGGYMQPQGHVQVVMNTVDYGLNPQAALDAPRWQWMQGRQFTVEHGFPQHVAKELARKGHQMQVAIDSGGFGRGQIIWRNEYGSYVGGTEPRCDGAVAVW
ncbi:MAG: gamma-glutamyltransferase family protein [Defluviitaleaceae bacterium]|nr:gamma-glutamyltransferase family protein [Defluviitaleaceae bacterium]